MFKKKIKYDANTESTDQMLQNIRERLNTQEDGAIEEEFQQDNYDSAQASNQESNVRAFSSISDDILSQSQQDSGYGAQSEQGFNQEPQFEPYNPENQFNSFDQQAQFDQYRQQNQYGQQDQYSQQAPQGEWDNNQQQDYNFSAESADNNWQNNDQYAQQGQSGYNAGLNPAFSEYDNAQFDNNFNQYQEQAGYQEYNAAGYNDNQWQQNNNAEQSQFNQFDQYGQQDQFAQNNQYDDQQFGNQSYAQSYGEQAYGQQYEEQQSYQNESEFDAYQQQDVYGQNQYAQQGQAYDQYGQFDQYGQQQFASNQQSNVVNIAGAINAPQQQSQSFNNTSVMTPGLQAMANQVIGNVLSAIPQDLPYNSMRVSQESSRTVEDLIMEAISPHLKSWMEQNFPIVLENVLTREVRKVMPNFNNGNNSSAGFVAASGNIYGSNEEDDNSSFGGGSSASSY